MPAWTLSILPGGMYYVVGCDQGADNLAVGGVTRRDKVWGFAGVAEELLVELGQLGGAEEGESLAAQRVGALGGCQW